MLLKTNNAKDMRKGITLVETLVASLLLASSLAPVLIALTRAQSLATTLEQKEQCLVLARQKIDDIRARAVYNYTTSFGSSSVQLSGYYYGKITDSTVSSNLRQITVSVGFDTNNNKTLDSSEILVTLTTMVAKRW
jgi:type II secretory pathway pseudopilin PulG